MRASCQFKSDQNQFQLNQTQMQIYNYECKLGFDYETSTLHSHVGWMQRALYDNFLDALLFIPFLDLQKMDRGSRSVQLRAREEKRPKFTSHILCFFALHSAASSATHTKYILSVSLGKARRICIQFVIKY